MATRKHVRGGRKLSAWLRRAKGSAPNNRGVILAVGYHDRAVASLAYQHEIGAGRLPVRAAFQLAIEDMKRVVQKAMQKGLSAGRRRAGDYTVNYDTIGRVASEALLQSYFNRARELKPVSPRRERAKAGTPGAGKPLIGVRGPRLPAKITHRRTSL